MSANWHHPPRPVEWLRLLIYGWGHPRLRILAVMFVHVVSAGLIPAMAIVVSVVGAELI